MADGYISQIKLPNEETYDFRDRNLKVYTGSCSTAAGTAIKDVVTDGIFTLEKGAVLFVNFTNTNSAAVGNLKLKINGEADTNAKPIKYLVNGNDPANIPGAGYLRANQTYMFRYDGTNWVADLNYYTYSNDFANRIGHYNNILARKAIAAESLIVGDETGYEKVASGVTFNLAYPIVWCTGAINANASNYANMFLQHYDRNIATGAKSGFTSTANKVIYLIVTINGNIATIDSNIITDTLPSSDDGKVYISLGKLGAQSTGANYFFLYPVHPMFWYKNGAIREYSGASQYALAAPLSGISGADDLKAIEAISGTTGLLKKTAANTWTLDTSNYVTSSGITSVTIGATSPVQSSTSTAQTGSSASTTISLKDAYGDTKNPYGTKAKNLVLAGPSSGNNAAPTFRALVAADIPNSILKWQTTTEESTALYDFGVYVNMNNANGSSMSGGNYFNILNVPYRKASGNTKADWGWQLGNTTSNDGRLWYRTSGDNVWGDWQTIAHATQSTSDTGSSSQPVYMTKTGVITAITAVGAAYGGTGKTTLKDSANALINALDTGSSSLTANDYVITQYVGGGTTTTTYHRRPASQVVNSTLVKAALGTVGTTAKKFLKDTGAWTQVAFSDLSGTATNAQLANSKVTIAGNDVSLGGSLTAATLTSSLGLSNALHFIGITSTTLADGSTTATLTPKTASPSSLSKTTGFVDGDIVMDGDQLREYVWSGSAWHLLGITTSTAYTQPASTATNTWIAQISQGTDGKITATTGSLNTSGTWSGNATTATTATNLANNPSIQTASNSNQITITAGGKTSSAYTVPYATSAGSATSATTATYIKCTDTRSTALNPTDLNAASGVRFDFKAKGTISLTATDLYAGVMSFRPYASGSDWSGGNAHQIAFNSEGLHWRNGGASWGNWYQILDSNNTAAGANATANMTWGKTYTLARINGTDIKVTMPGNPNTNTTYTFAEGSTNGAFSVTPSGGSAQSISIHGLGTAAYKAVENFAAASHTHSYLANTNAGAADRPIYITGNAASQTTYRMAGTNVTATTALAITNDLDTGIWYVNGTSGILSQGDGAAYVNKYSNSWLHEIYGDYRTGHIAVRGKNNGTWKDWLKVLDSGNYTDYTVTKTGTGATGSNWGISITGSSASCTGNAATATLATSANYVNLYEARGTTTTLNKTANYVGAGKMFHLVASSSTATAENGKPPLGDANVLQMNWDNNGGYDAQLAISTGANRMEFRDRVSAKNAWREVVTITPGTAVGNTNTPVYVDATGVVQALGFTIAKSVPSNAVFTDTNNAVAHALKTTTKFYITGTESATASTGGDTFDTGIYATTIAGQLNATSYKVNEKVTLQWNSTDSSLDFVFA